MRILHDFCYAVDLSNVKTSMTLNNLEIEK